MVGRWLRVVTEVLMLVFFLFLIWLGVALIYFVVVIQKLVSFYHRSNGFGHQSKGLRYTEP